MNVGGTNLQAVYNNLRVSEVYFGGHMRQHMQDLNKKILQGDLLEQIKTKDGKKFNVCMPEMFVVPFDPKNVQFPSDCKYGNLDEPNIGNTLFTNAWDPNSMAGNSNTTSIDGGYGQMSAIAWLAWPNTNLYLEKNIKGIAYPAPKEAPVKARERDYVY